MLEGMKDLLGGAKDRLVSAGAKAYVNQKIAKVGEFTRLDIDTEAKSVRATLLFKGEVEPVEMTILGYALFELEGKCFARMESFESSRPWLTEIAKGLVVGTEFKISRTLYDSLKMLL